VTLRAGAQPGDVLVLTKPLGTGIIAFAAQIDRAPAGALEAAARSMTALNKTAAERMLLFGVHGCTDVTGFGLMGHLAEMAAGSGVDVEIVWDDLPLLPGVLECAAQGVMPGSVERNRESCAAAVTLGAGVSETMLDVCMDAQTSGGLLIALAERDAAGLLAQLHEDGIAEAAVIGKVCGKGAGRLSLVTRGARPIAEWPGGRAPAAVAAEESGAAPCCAGSSGGGSPEGEEGEAMAKEGDESGCCPEGHGGAAPAAQAGVTEMKRKFQEFQKEANQAGALDAATKQAIALALSVLARCEPCVKVHIAKARKMGFSQEEIDEAAWMAIAFGGSPVMMFYEKHRAG
jgi:AhpD family alkylhydroperoxidase